MYVTQITPTFKYYDYIRQFLNDYIDLPLQQNYKIPANSIIMMSFSKDIQQEIDQLNQHPPEQSAEPLLKQLIPLLLGAVVIFNQSTAKQTVEIQVCRMSDQTFLTKRMIYILYEYLFEVLKVRRVISRVSSVNPNIIQGFKNFGYHETIIPDDRAIGVHEHYLYYDKQHWTMVRRNYSGSNAADKNHLARLRAKLEPWSIPLPKEWDSIPDQVRAIALYLPENKRTEFLELLNRHDRPDQMA